MIRDARVFQTDFVPNDVVHRDTEINHLSSVLQPIADGDPGTPAFLHGPSGTGKTCIAQYTVEKLREQVISLNTQYVNCWENHSRFKVLYRILEGLDNTFDIHRQSTPTDVLIDRLHEYDGPRYVIILDEADQLTDKELLYELLRTQNLELIFIANEEIKFFAELNDRLASRMQTCARIKFDSYSDEKLIAILRDRIDWGLEPGVISEEQLNEIADQAAGDARVAIGTLRVAARIADGSGASEIKPEHIQSAVSEAKTEIQQKTVEKLTDDQRVLYEIITEHNAICPGDLYEAYTDRVEDARTKRMVRNYLQKMEHYNLIKSRGENRGREYIAVP
ncbi:Cdc6/Cdc18 family protein [Salinibaculum rarum]|uniref:Cdc6/Cdc18 family protein n=1 Tax=Salinibaculum rarum TaxID=3058903 RepID=UPI00265E4EAA|nr:Cdc6/Cdc18 family protein [Salinibaculum sp. KK48]